MKDATGELSTTVITIVAIAAISTLFLVFLYPQLKANIILNQACSNGPGYTGDGNGYKINCSAAGVTTVADPAGATNNVRQKTCNSNGAAEANTGQTWVCKYGRTTAES